MKPEDIQAIVTAVVGALKPTEAEVDYAELKTRFNKLEADYAELDAKYTKEMDKEVPGTSSNDRSR
jgi:hypothetical protein